MGDLMKIVLGGMAGPVFLILGFLMMFQLLRILNVDPAPVISVMVALSPIWIPMTLFYVTFEKWMYHVQLKFVHDNGRTTLRINLPQEVFKSPEAMESVLAQIHNVNTPDNLMQTYLDGKHPLTFSFELVSIGGEVRFYINVPTKKTKNAVEAQLYAQYPGIEVVEEQFDYADEIQWNPEKYEMMSFHMGKKKDDVLPIKTYIDFGMDRLPKEENEKFEPMAAMLEQMSKLKPHERLWVQILAIPHVERNFKNGTLRTVPTWVKKGEDKINEILKRDERVSSDPDDAFERAPMLTMGERDNVAAIERNIGKYAYEVGIRWMYITEKGKFDGNVISPMIRTFSQYDIITRNGVGVRWRTDFDYNYLSDRSGRRKNAWKKSELYDYKNRYYYTRDRKNWLDKEKVMSVEEIATMYHIPGSSVLTPSLPRIMSTRKEAPANLPTGLIKTI